MYVSVSVYVCMWRLLADSFFASATQKSCTRFQVICRCLLVFTSQDAKPLAFCVVFLCSNTRSPAHCSFSISSHFLSHCVLHSYSHQQQHHRLEFSLWPSLLTLLSVHTHTHAHIDLIKRVGERASERERTWIYRVVVSVAVNLTSPQLSQTSHPLAFVPLVAVIRLIEFILLFRFVTIFAIIYLFASHCLCVRVSLWACVCACF